MKLHETSKKKSLKTLIAAMIVMTALTPMQAMAYSPDQVSNLNNQIKVESTLTFESNQKVGVAVNGQKVALKNPAYVTGGRTLLPVRGIAELLNAQVDFQPGGEKGLVQITKDANEVLLQLGRNKIMKNGEMSAIDPSNSKIGAATFNGITYLPLRAVADALGVQVEYSNGVVNIITDPNYVAPVAPVTHATPATPAENPNGYKLVNNTNDELVTTMMDANSKQIEGEYFVVPEGLVYKNPTGLKPGDVLIVEQKRALVPELVKSIESSNGDLNKTSLIYVPMGARVSTGGKGWAYTDLSSQGALGYGFRDMKVSGVLTSSGVFNGVIVYKDGTHSAFSAGSGRDIRSKGITNVKYILYSTGAHERENRQFVTFYN